MMIQNHPEKELIQELRSLEHGSEGYKKIKSQLPCIKPHGTFNGIGTKDTFKAFSGYLYFDIDDCDVKLTQEFIMNKYADKVCLIGKSIGGKGIFFYIKLSNPERLTQENFIEVQNYFIKYVFSDLDIDTSAKGICRNQIITYDNDVYYNQEIIVTIPDIDLRPNYTVEINEEKGIGKEIKKKKEEAGRDIFNYTLLPIKDVLRMIRWRRYIGTGDEDYIIEDIEVCDFFVQKCIKDGKKRFVFPKMINGIMFNNPDIELQVLSSYMNFINYNYTDGKPMKQQYLMFMVEREFNRIRSGGKISGTRIKRVHTNPRLDTLTRKRIAARVNGGIRKERSCNLIEAVVEALQEKGIKPSNKRVAAFLKGYISICTVKKYLQSVVSNLPDNSDETILEKPAVQKLKFKSFLMEFIDTQKTQEHHRHYKESPEYRWHYNEFLQTYNIMSGEDS